MTEAEHCKPSTSASGIVPAIVLTMFHAALWAGVAIILLSIVPRFERTFADFGLELPAAAVLSIRISDGATANWLLIPVVGIVGIALDLFLLLAIGRSGPAAQTIAGVLLAIVPLLIGGLVLLSVLIPWFNFIEGLQ